MGSGQSASFLFKHKEFRKLSVYLAYVSRSLGESGMIVPQKGKLSPRKGDEDHPDLLYARSMLMSWYPDEEDVGPVNQKELDRMGRNEINLSSELPRQDLLEDSLTAKAQQANSVRSQKLLKGR